MKHVVGFSGGVDSQAAAKWARNRYGEDDVILLNSDAGGNEHPITTRFVAEYSEKVHPVISVSAIISDIDRPGPLDKAASLGLAMDAPLTFPLLATLKGFFPSSQFRFCTEALKMSPQLRWMNAHIVEEYERYSGVRRDESSKRKNQPFRSWDAYYDCYLNCPIADWTKQMCFDYVRQFDEPINPLYSLGFDRVGCAPCVNSGKDDITNWVNRAPEMIDKVDEWEQQTGLRFFRNIFPGMAEGRIREVVEWARTDRGGYQFNILKELELPSCSSNYGLCE